MVHSPLVNEDEASRLLKEEYDAVALRAGRESRTSRSGT